MKAWYRYLAAIVVAIYVALGWSPAHASFPASSSPNESAIATYQSDGVAACAAFFGPNRPADRCIFTRTEGNQTTAVNISYWSNSSIAYTVTCPANSTNSSGQCTCNAPTWVQEGNTCISLQTSNNKSCKALADGLNIVGAPMVHYGSPSTTACFGGYVIKGSGGAGGTLGGVATQSELYGPFSCSGQDASACSVVPKPTAISATCDAGSFPGEVNGLQVCIPPTNTVQQPKTTTSEAPASGGTPPSLPGAPPGTVESSEQTTCTKGTCTTTTTNKDATGASTGTAVKTESQADYCVRAPTAPGCEKLTESSFSGQCGGGFTFKGDAIQGAIAQEIHKQNCLMNAATGESAKYDLAKAVTGDVTGTLPGNTTVNFGPASFDTSDSIGGKQCVGNITATILGSTITLPFGTYICPHAQNFRLILLALGFFIGYVIIARRS